MNNSKIILVLVVVSILLGMLGNNVRKEQDEFDAFVKKYDCKIVSIGLGSYVIPTPKDAIVISGKTGYKCNDGITYYR